jgi:hypothetical protein
VVNHKDSNPTSNMYNFMRYQPETMEDANKSEGMNSTDAVANMDQGDGHGSFISEGDDLNELTDQTKTSCPQCQFKNDP